MIKYTKQDIDKELLKLGMSNTWSSNKKRKFILEIFEKWNGKIISLHDKEELKEAEEILELCGAAMTIYKSKPHKRNYKKTTTKKKTKTTKKKTKTTKKKTKKSGDGEGCWGWLALVILFLLSIFGC